MPAVAGRNSRRFLGLGARAVVHLLAAPVSTILYVLIVVPFSRARILVQRAGGKKPAVLWGPIPIINIRYSSRGERLYGYRSDTLVYRVYHINARGDFDYVLDRLYSIPVLGSLVPYGAFLWAGFRYDVFGFFFEGGLLAATPWWWLELPVLRLAGKKIVVYPYGPDARIASLTRGRDRWNAYTDVPPDREDRKETVVRRKLAVFARFANVMLGCADLVDHLPRLDGVFLFPFDTESWQPVEPPEDDVVTVVHGPNHRHYKGTRFVQEAVEKLKSEGLPVELVLVEGMPTSEARRVYERADIVADQFLIGAYALFAIETMALGKPVLCYLNPRFDPFHPEWADCPIVRADPDTLMDELRRLVVDPERRRSIGRRGPEYVRKYHSLAAVGARMDAIYRELWRADSRRIGAAGRQSA